MDNPQVYIIADFVALIGTPIVCGVADDEIDADHTALRRTANRAANLCD